MRPKFLLIVAAAAALGVAAASWALSWPPPRLLLLTPHAHRAACPPLLGAAATDIVVYIPSPIPWRARRRQVLRTMRPDLLDDAHLYFVLGTRAGGPQLEREAEDLAAARREAAEEEAADPRVRYLFVACRDLGDMPDDAGGTSSTTCKVYEALRHIARAYAAAPPRFVWRGADDAHLDLRVFRAHVLPRLQTCRLFLGRIRFPMPGEDADLELLPAQPRLYALYGLRKFGKYMVGMGFCMSWDVVRLLGAGPVPPRLTWAEDVMVGQWLLFYDVDFVDIRQIVGAVGMHHADQPDELAWLATEAPPTYKLLLAHRLSAAQWRALERRPRGDASARFLLLLPLQGEAAAPPS